MERENILKLFPAFAEIRNADLREKSIKAMETAVERGGWADETIKRCPVSMKWKNCDVSLIEHINDVVELCLFGYDRMEKYYKRHNLSFDHDIVLAGALLHDVAKLTEFVVENGEIVHSENYKLMRHPLAGALIASETGLPDIIIQIGRAHV